MMQVCQVMHKHQHAPCANTACTTEEAIVKQVFALHFLLQFTNHLSIHHALSPLPASLLKWLLDHLLLFLVGLNICGFRQCHCAAVTASWLPSRRMLW